MAILSYYEVREIKNLRESFDGSKELYGERPAFWVKRPPSVKYQSISFNEFWDDYNAFGTALIDLGLKDKKIVVIGENRYEWCVSYLGVVNGTGTVVPMDKELPLNEIENLVAIAEVDAIVYSGRKTEEIKALSKKLKNIVCIGMDLEKEDNGHLSYSELVAKGKKLIEEGDRRFFDADIDNEAPLMLLFTSATTSASKAVQLSHRNIVSNIMAMTSLVKIVPEDIFLSVLPYHHTYECTCGFCCVQYTGASVAYCEGLRHIQKNMEEAKITCMLGVPLLFETMYKKIWKEAAKSGMDKKLKLLIKVSNGLKNIGVDIRRKLFKKILNAFGGEIRMFVSGAAAVDPEVCEGFGEFGILMFQGYGLTECSPILALNSDVNYKAGAAGLPLPGIDIKIDKPNDEGIGEIKAKGPNIMIGYYKNTEANEKVFDKEGYFLTGDMGYIDDDGFLFITGRKKNVIVTKNGKNIYPEEIESLLSNIKLIKECFIFGKEEKDSDELVVSLMAIPDMEAVIMETGNENITTEEVRKMIEKNVKEINKKLVNYKNVKKVYIKEGEFEKTTTHKIKRYKEIDKSK